MRIGAAGQLVQKLIDLPYLIEIRLGDRTVQKEGPDRDGEIMREDTQEGVSRLGVQPLERGENFFYVKWRPLNHGSVGILNRWSVESFRRFALTGLHGSSSRGRSLTG